MILLFILSLEAPLRMPQILLTTPLNVYEFTPLDQYEDFFLSYPLLELKNDSVYFRGSSNVLLLLDGVPINSLQDICLPAIQKIELLAEHASSPYGDYDAVLNIITKKFSRDTPWRVPTYHSELSPSVILSDSEESPPYSNIRLNKNPDHTQFEFGRKLFTPFDFYLSGHLNSPTRWLANLGFQSKFINLRTYYVSRYIGILLHGSLFSNFKFSLTQDFFSIIQHLNFKNHKLLLGTDLNQNSTAFFIQDYWEPRPLLYLVPSLRYDEEKQKIYPKISAGFIPQINTTLFSSLSQDQASLGIRIFDSSIIFSQNLGCPAKGGTEHSSIETRLTTPRLFGLKLTTAFELFIPSFTLSDNWTIIAEYSQGFKNGNLGLYILSDLLTETVRFEIRIIDARVFYRLNPGIPSYGLSWQFQD